MKNPCDFGLDKPMCPLCKEYCRLYNLVHSTSQKFITLILDKIRPKIN